MSQGATVLFWTGCGVLLAGFVLTRTYGGYGIGRLLSYLSEDRVETVGSRLMRIGGRIGLPRVARRPPVETAPRPS